MFAKGGSLPAHLPAADAPGDTGNNWREVDIPLLLLCLLWLLLL
jgi:hypothetical protein